MMDNQLTPLGQAFGFTPQALRSNRQGQLSPEQRRDLWLRFGLVSGGGVALVFTPMLLAWGLVMWVTDSITFSDQRALVGYLIGLLLGVIYVAANYRTLLLGIDLFRGRVLAITAPVKVWGQYLLMQQYRFVVEEKDLALIKTGLTYRAFILPYSQTLLSIEFSE